MKKIILSFSLLLCFLHSKAQLFHEDFEVADSVISSGNPGWNLNNRLSVGGIFCDSASIQNIGDTSILSTLFFDCSNASKVFLSFDHICQIDFFDQAIIEVSVDNGNTFTKLTSLNCYNAGQGWNLVSGVTGSFSTASYPNWLSGTIPDNTWWHHEIFNLNNLLAYQPSVIIRFKLYDGNNNGGLGNAGWFADNLSVDTVALPNVGVKSILGFDITTIADSLKPIDVNVKNFGADTLFSFNVSYSFNAGTPVTQPWTGILAPGDTVVVSFPPANIPSGQFSLCAFTDMAGDYDSSNDTLCITGNGIPILSIPYIDDFEGPSSGWIDPNSSGTSTIWELGPPNYGSTDTAHSGTRCWDVNLDTSYFASANAILYSPYFDFSTIGNASLSFWQNRNTEPGDDGFRLEYNINGGGWQLLGLANNPYTNNWYSDSSLNATQLPAWEGSSNGWIESSYPLPSSLANQLNVQFRFVFSSDPAVNFDGVSIDDFSITLASCGSTINNSAIPGVCGDNYTFNYNSITPVVSQFWDLGNGTVSNLATANGLYTYGTYTITLYTVDTSNCAASDVDTIIITTGFSVNTGPDVFACLAPAQLNAVPSNPGAYTYSWSPFAGLNNPFIPNPQASHVDSLTYTVTVTDTITGCVASDQIMVSAYSGHNDSITICLGGATILDLGPGGGSTYTWLNYTDTSGNVYPINANSQSYLVSQPGTYTAYATFPLCGTINSTFYIEVDTICITDVWPGDCNYDQVANNKDLLNIGLSYNLTGPLRPAATPYWNAQPSPDWLYYFVAGINYKHSDCDGNGIVDSLDVPVILANYDSIHPLKQIEETLSPGTPPIYLTADVDTAGNSDVILVTVNLGTSLIPVDSIYGIAYTITYEQNLIDTTSASMDFSNSWLGIPGTDAITLEKYFSPQGFSDFAICRKDHLNIINGSGSLAVMAIVTTDNLSGKTILHFNITDVKAITHSEYIIPLIGIGDSVVLDPNYLNGTGDVTVESNITVFPNPVRDELIVRSKNLKIISIELKNALGQLVYKTEATGVTTHIRTAELANGIFFLSVLTDKGVISKKVQVIK